MAGKDNTTTNSPAVTPWKVYPRLFQGEVSMGAKTYRFIAEDLDVEPVELDSLSLEFFNHELQKVDTSSAQQVVRFCEQWGLMLSPLYMSKTLALTARPGGAHLDKTIYPTVYSDGIEAVERRVIADAAGFGGSTGFTSPDYATPLLVGSLYAREAIAKGEFSGRKLGAAVSIDEAAYTIRLLQVATALLSAQAAGLTASDLLYYLLNDKHMQRRCPDELTERGVDLFLASQPFGEPLPASDERAEKAAAEVAGLGEAVPGDVADIKARMERILVLQMEQAAEAARSFVSRAILALEAENAGVRGSGGSANVTGVIITEGSLLEAILINFRFVMDAPFEWLTCEWCGKVFKYQKEYDPKNRYRKSTFCRNSCRVMSHDKGDGDE
jgi:hypothetical protein